MVSCLKKVIILIGASVSGKTYFANWLKKKDCKYYIVSSDEHRKKRTGTYDNIFKNPVKHFRSLDKELLKSLEEHDYIILDAVNISRCRRCKIINQLNGKAEIISIELRVPITKCIRQDKSERRGHTAGVRAIVIMKFFSFFNRPRLEEGFDILTTRRGYIKSFVL